jgi:hypothetical protein
MAITYGWQKRYAKNDEKTSIILQTLHILEALLPCKCHVIHEHRRSSKGSILADNLTREATTTTTTWTEVESKWLPQPNSPLVTLVKTATIDWEFPTKFADYVNHILSK